MFDEDCCLLEEMIEKHMQSVVKICIDQDRKTGRQPEKAEEYREEACSRSSASDKKFKEHVLACIKRLHCTDCEVLQEKYLPWIISYVNVAALSEIYPE